MKLKQFIVITDPSKFLRGDYGTCFSMFDSAEYLPSHWMVVGETEFDVTADTGKLIKIVSDQLDEKIGQATAALNVLEQRKAELLAITDQS